MKDELIGYETARVAKEKGFNLKVYNYFQIGAISKGVEEHSTKYINDINTTFKESAMFSRPTQGLLQRWLREVHNTEVLISILPKQIKDKANKKKYCAYVLNENWNPTIPSIGNFDDSYELAKEAGLLEALKLI